MTERTAMRVLMVQDRFWWVFGFEFVIADRLVPVRERSPDTGISLDRTSASSDTSIFRIL
jgi:hypothetical protein